MWQHIAGAQCFFCKRREGETMARRKKIFITALLTLALAVASFVIVNRCLSDSFSLSVYEEGQPIMDSSIKAPGDARLTKAYSPKGHFIDYDDEGNVISDNFVFWMPVTVASEKEPAEVVYRCLGDDEGISLPYGSKASELTVSGKDSTGYMQVWFYIGIHKEYNGYYEPEPAFFDAECIKECQQPLFEVEVRYQDGFVAKKKYSLFPGEKGEYDCLESLAVLESQD